MKVALVFAVLLIFTWGKLGDPFVDYGRDAYAGWQMLDRSIYADFDYLYGPLAPSVCAICFYVFGFNLTAMMLVDAAILALTCAALWKVLPRSSATIGVVLFLLLFGFGNFTRISNYNFITPYTRAATYGFSLCIFALAFRDRPYLAGICSGLALLTKPEMAVAAMIGGAVVTRFSPRWFVGCVLAPASVVAILSLRTPLPDLLNGCAGGYLMAFDPRISEMKFFKVSSGTDFVSRSAMKIVTYFCLYCQFLIPPLLLGLWWKKGNALVAILIGLSIASFVAFVPMDPRTMKDIARGVPLLLLVVFAACVAGKSWARAALCLMAGLLAMRMALNFRLFQYGFVQAALAFVVCAVAVVDWLPRWLSAVGAYPHFVRAAGLGMLAGVCVILYRAERMVLEGRDAPVNGLPMVYYDDKAKAVNRLASIVNGDSLAAWPHFVSLNLITGLPNPTKYELLNEVGIIAAGGESKVVESIESNPPRWVVMSNDDGFGVNYGQAITAHVRDRYSLVDTVGGFQLLLRKDAEPLELGGEVAADTFRP